MAKIFEALSGAIRQDSGLTESDQLIVENTIADLFSETVDKSNILESNIERWLAPLNLDCSTDNRCAYRLSELRSLISAVAEFAIDDYINKYDLVFEGKSARTKLFDSLMVLLHSNISNRRKVEIMNLIVAENKNGIIYGLDYFADKLYQQLVYKSVNRNNDVELAADLVDKFGINILGSLTPVIDRYTEIVEAVERSKVEIIRNNIDSVIGIILSQITFQNVMDNVHRFIKDLEDMIVEDDRIDNATFKDIAAIIVANINVALFPLESNIANKFGFLLGQVVEYRNIIGRTPRNGLFYFDNYVLGRSRSKADIMMVHKTIMAITRTAIKSRSLSSIIRRVMLNPSKNISIINILISNNAAEVISLLDKFVLIMDESSTETNVIDEYMITELINGLRTIGNIRKFVAIFGVHGKTAALYLRAFIEINDHNKNGYTYIENIGDNTSREKVLYRMIFNKEDDRPVLIVLIEKLIKTGDTSVVASLYRINRIDDIMANKKKTVIPTTEIIEDEYTLRELPKTDIRGPVIGAYTNCCQRLGDAGAFCAINATISMNSTNIVVERKGHIVANSWIWIRDNIVVFDNVEVKEDNSIDAGIIKELFEKYSEFLIENGIVEVRIGGGNNDIAINTYAQTKELIETPRLMENLQFQEENIYSFGLEGAEHGYSDAKRAQYIINKKPSEVL